MKSSLSFSSEKKKGKKKSSVEVEPPASLLPPALV